MASEDVEIHELSGFADAAIRLFRALEANRQRLATSHGLSSLELRALLRVAAQGRVTPKILATDLAVTKGAVTGLSDRLISLGHLRRAEHPSDRRSLFLELTPEGNALMRGIHTSFREMIEAATGVVDDSALEVTTRSIGAVAAEIDLALKRSGDPDPSARA